jgi:hypothetical protein
MKPTKVDDHSFIFHIESKCAYPGQCIYTPDKPLNSLTIGAIVIYLLVSMLILRFVKHEQGINLIPNRTLWLEIGTDSIRGVRFISSKVTRRNTYEKI